MTAILILLGTVTWGYVASFVYSRLVGRNLQSCSEDATGFACATGIILSILIMLSGGV